jgi:hypothetical protein
MHSARSAFRRALGRDPGRVNPFRMPVQHTMPQPLDPGALYHFWHPEREGVEWAPDVVQRRLLEIGGRDAEGAPILVCCRPPAGAPIRCRGWNVFFRKIEVTHHLSPGWMLILAWNDGDEPHPKPLPIDSRMYANLYLQSLKGGRASLGRDFENAAEYFEGVVQQIQHDQASEDKRQENYRHDRAKDLFQSHRISTAGRGNRFALHHDGTILPSRGERNWLIERARHQLPAHVLKAEREYREKRGR